jgi:hypothetical protein
MAIFAKRTGQWSFNQQIEQYLRRVARQVNYKRLNPPRELCIDWVDIPDEWISVGYIPTPRTRLGWFTYHLIHGLAMRYPLRSVIAFSLLHTNPYGSAPSQAGAPGNGKDVVNDDQKSDQTKTAGSLAR